MNEICIFDKESTSFGFYVNRNIETFKMIKGTFHKRVGLPLKALNYIGVIEFEFLNVSSLSSRIDEWAICFAKHFALLQFLLCGDVHCLLPRGKRKEPHAGEGFSPEYDPWFGRGVFYRVKLFITSITCAMSSSLSALPLGRHRPLSKSSSDTEPP